MIEIDKESSTNAIAITFEGKEYLFMGYYEDFEASELDDVFHDIIYVHIKELI